MRRTPLIIMAVVLLALIVLAAVIASNPTALAVPLPAADPTATTSVVGDTPTVVETETPPPDPTMPAEPTETGAPPPDPTMSQGTAAFTFDGQRAYADVEYQVSLGPRLPGSEAHARAVEWMLSELTNAGWEAGVQEAELMGHPIHNVVARRGSGDTWLIIGAHYDSRFWADADPDTANHREPVPGANDGASGVAVLLELARALPADLDRQVWLVFFDAEDQGRIPDWDWILGSRAFAASLDDNPDAVMVVDMIGDADQDIYMESNSDPELTEQVWAIAAELGYGDRIISEYRHTMLDDHIPFVERGIPSVLLIDFDYPYWHTLEDTPDKVSAQSLQAVGDTVATWILRY